MTKNKLSIIGTIAFCLIGLMANAQARLVLNGAFINIKNNAVLVIDNSNENAITRNSGHIISEGENNQLKWNIGTAIGNYVIPFGYNTTDYLPTKFTTSGAVGNGSFTLSTYYGGSTVNSSFLPTGVTNFNNGLNNNSNYGVDRFWQVNASGYTTKPTLSNLYFSYRDAEHNIAPNTIVESNLIAQRWNNTLNQWHDFIPSGNVNTTLNSFIIPTLSNTQLFAWWSLVDAAKPLPVDILSFDALNIEKGNLLKWTTFTEKNNSYFEVQKSNSELNFSTITTIKTKAINGTSNAKLDYEFLDENVLNNVTYYRLVQVDVDGKKIISKTVALKSKQNTAKITAFPNPSNGIFNVSIVSDENTNATIEMFDATGKIVLKQQANINDGDNTLKLNISNMPTNNYYLKITNTKGISKTLKLLKN